MDNWLVAARLVGGRVAKPVTHSSTEPNTRLGVRPHARSVQFSIARNVQFSFAIDTVAALVSIYGLPTVTTYDRRSPHPFGHTTCNLRLLHLFAP